MAKVLINHLPIKKALQEVDDCAVEYDKCIERMLALVAEIPSAWDGDDSKVFLSNFESFLKDSLKIPRSFRAFSGTAKMQAFRYKKGDQESVTLLERMKSQYDEYKNQDDRFR